MSQEHPPTFLLAAAAGLGEGIYKVLQGLFILTPVFCISLWLFIFEQIQPQSITRDGICIHWWDMKLLSVFSNSVKQWPWFWHSLPGSSVRSHRLGAQSYQGAQSCPLPLSQMPIMNPVITWTSDRGCCSPFPGLGQFARAAYRTQENSFFSRLLVYYKWI